MNPDETTLMEQSDLVHIVCNIGRTQVDESTDNNCPEIQEKELGQEC